MKEILTGTVAELHRGGIRADARSLLEERLRSGEAVRGITFRDLIDSELDTADSGWFIDALDTLLRKDGGNDTAEGFAHTLRDKLIASYLDANPDLITDEVQRLELAEQFA